MKLKVQLPGQNEVTIEAREGWTVMEAIRDSGLPVIAQCGGGKVCATCHVHVDTAFFNYFTLPDEDEKNLIESSDNYDEERSRLSCQLILKEVMDGLIVYLQPDSADI